MKEFNAELGRGRDDIISELYRSRYAAIEADRVEQSTWEEEKTNLYNRPLALRKRSTYLSKADSLTQEWAEKYFPDYPTEVSTRSASGSPTPPGERPEERVDPRFGVALPRIPGGKAGVRLDRQALPVQHHEQ